MNHFVYYMKCKKGKKKKSNLRRFEKTSFVQPTVQNQKTFDLEGFKKEKTATTE